MSIDNLNDEVSRPKGTVPFQIPAHNFFLDDYVQEQLRQMQRHLEDAFIAETIAKLSAILKDPKHPAYHTVKQLVLEAQNATTRP